MRNNENVPITELSFDFDYGAIVDLAGVDDVELSEGLSFDDWDERIDNSASVTTPQKKRNILERLNSALLYLVFYRAIKRSEERERFSEKINSLKLR